MTKKEKTELFNKRYSDWHQYFLVRNDSLPENQSLSYEKRLELEGIIKQLVQFCRDNSLYMYKPNDIDQFMIQLEGNGSDKIRHLGFNFCTSTSCYASVQFSMSAEEIVEEAKKMAQMDVELAENNEVSSKKKKEQEIKEQAECKRRYEEACRSRDQFMKIIGEEDYFEMAKEALKRNTDKEEILSNRAKEFDSFVKDDIEQQEKAAARRKPKSKKEKKEKKIAELQAKSIQQAHELGELLAARNVKDEFLDADAPDENAPNIEEIREKAIEALAESKKDQMDKIASNVYYALHGDAIADELIKQVNAYANLKDYDALADFNFSMCDHDELAAVDEYIFQCQRFTDAQNHGLTGLGLYTFNNDRMDAHEKMLEAWGLSDDPVALSATKGFDFCSEWNYKTKLYDARPKEEAELMLCWILWKCKNFNRQESQR